MHFYIQPIGHLIILSKKEKQLTLSLSSNNLPCLFKMPPKYVEKQT